MDGQTCDLAEIFKDYGLKKRFRKRTSSANWHEDQLSAKEILLYKQSMGFVKKDRNGPRFSPANSLVDSPIARSSPSSSPDSLLKSDAIKPTLFHSSTNNVIR